MMADWCRASLQQLRDSALHRRTKWDKTIKEASDSKSAESNFWTPTATNVVVEVVVIRFSNS